MPRDIRSYFPSSSNAKCAASIGAPKGRKRAVISSDEEDVKKQSPVKRTKLSRTSRKHHVLSDSDDDGVNADQLGTKSEAERSERRVPEKLVSPADVFGKRPIQREDAPKVHRTVQKVEAEFHDDQEFEATLGQLDTSKIERRYLSSPSKSDTDNNGTTVESKLNTESTDKRQTRALEEKSDTSRRETGDVKEVSRKELSKTAKSPAKRAKVSPKTRETDVYEERIERKKQSAALYQQYLQRGGARNPGTKQIPRGAEYCLAGLSFLITGILDSLEREEAEELIKNYGGRILHQVSRKTDFVIVGDQPGPSKLAKAESLNVKRITEDDLLDMIRTRSAGRASDVVQSRSRSRERTKQKSPELERIHESSPRKARLDAERNLEAPRSDEVGTNSRDESKGAESDRATIVERQSRISNDTERNGQSGTSRTGNDTKGRETIDANDIGAAQNSSNGEALVEKYRPTTMKQILGQQGDKSNAKKLYNWMKNWHNNHSGNRKLVKPSPWAKDDDGSFFKAALLSGPPGVGKTTTAQVVCNELGFDLLEFNASDTRSKKLLKEEVSDLLNNTTIKGYFSECKIKPSAKHALLMDEVDGMAGNEDRGGLQELINLIKNTDIPIICACNDRNNPKMRTLANYTFDLRFQKPRLEQIRGAMKSICYKENIQMSTEDLDRLIESTNHDIRQVINHLALLAAGTARQETTGRKHANKDLKLGPWEVARKVFSAEEHKTMSIHDKSDLFFHDYNIAALFVQENYLLVTPDAPKDETMERVAQTAESLEMGDLVEKAIRSSGAWSLLPMQACYSLVIPGSLMSGHITGQLNFPAWLGRNSKASKFDRLLQEITVHTRLTTGASKEAINSDYLTHLRDAIVRPLASNDTDNVEKAVHVMNCYHLMREDVDSLIEVSLWPGQRDPMQAVDSKVKAAFTRAYNKHGAAVPYAVTGNAAKKKSAHASQDEGFIEGGENGEEVESGEDEDNVETDKMIKAKKPTAGRKTESGSKKKKKSQNETGTSTEKPSKRGRGRGRGK